MVKFDQYHTSSGQYRWVHFGLLLHDADDPEDTEKIARAVLHLHYQPPRLYGVEVAPDYRGHGFGSMLMEGIIAEFDRFQLYVSHTPHAKWLIDWYTRLGFVVKGHRENVTIMEINKNDLLF
jgi:ribosomal protein S18 acetylase RimI-like enzyme